MPGHGRSSPLQLYLPLHLIDYCIALKVVLDSLKFENCYALGHSMGGFIIARTAQLYPSYFRKIVLIDGAYSLPIEIEDYKKYILSKFSGIIRYQQAVKEQREQRTYTYEEALIKASDNRRYQPLTREKAKPILNRMIELVDGEKYRFTVDPRCKYIMSPLHDSKYAADLVKRYPITCSMLVIVDTAHDDLFKLFLPVLKQFEKQKNITVKYISANHDMHITIPHVIAPFICDLFNKVPASKL